MTRRIIRPASKPAEPVAPPSSSEPAPQAEETAIEPLAFVRVLRELINAEAKEHDALLARLSPRTRARLEAMQRMERAREAREDD